MRERKSWEGEVVNRVLKNRSQNNGDRKEAVGQLLGDRQVLADLRSERNHWSAQRLFVGSDQQKYRQTKLRLTVDYSIQVSGGLELCIKGTGVSRYLARKRRSIVRTARAASVNTKGDQKKFMDRRNTENNSVERKRVELKFNQGK